MTLTNIKIETTVEAWLAALHVDHDHDIVPATNKPADLTTDLPPGAYEVTFAGYQTPRDSTVKIIVWTDEENKKSRSIYARKGRFSGRLEFIIDENGDLS